MNTLYKILQRADYSNIYNIKRALNGIEAEFMACESLEDKTRAEEIINLAGQFYKGFPNPKDNISLSFWKNKSQKLHKYLIKRYNGWK